MTLLLLAAGGLLVAVSVVDLITTTVFIGGGAGPLTRTVSRRGWGLARRLWPGRHRALARAGATVVLAAAVTWVVLGWIGWTLVFSSVEGAVVRSSTGQPASVEQRAYFTGYTLLTLGIGDFRPDGPLWRLATVLAVGHGFAMVTLAITYLVPVVSAATERRTLAARLHLLGPAPHDLLLGAWDGQGFARLADRLDGVADQLLLHLQRHHTYPVLHCFHAADPTTAAPLRLAALDEALTMLQHGVARQARPDDRSLTLLRRVLDRYLDDVVAGYVRPAVQPPPIPSLRPLCDAGVPTVDAAAFTAAVADLADRRRRLHGLVVHDAWDWQDIGR